jgi:non-specific serine/threonine protein kinase
VLDNCEHLIESRKETASYLLQQCPNLTILATSRRSLNLRLERLFPLAPLKTPELGSTNFDEIQKNDSVRLFVERARQRSPEYELEPSNRLMKKPRFSLI